MVQTDEERTANQKKNRDKPESKENRLKVLQYYSKRLSKSNIPCCNCCGLNSHIEFLTVDHIAGRQEMDSEPELKKLKYMSKLSGTALVIWIIKNNFPKGFQILCHNCNQTKGYYGQCPLENKPH
ncbi:MAG: hypothetical protein ABR53_04920 [Nitrosopumilus sp. BACL13 MAG-121220-bin23]|nr:MAG: hypothetical protein ABR53_04920 [Nitrosopumilus sp. BACL13 MAG-121220-bin23]